MEIESKLLSLLDALVPATAPEDTAQRLTIEAMALLKSSNVSSDQVMRIVRSNETKTDLSAQNNVQWRKVEAILQMAAGLQDMQEMSQYLTFMENMMMRSPVPKRANIYGYPLNRQLLETHDGFLGSPQPLGSYAESFENIDKLSDRRSMISSALHQDDSRAQNEVTLSSLSSAFFSTIVNEAEILRYLPYTLLGTTSTLFLMENGKISIPSNIPNGESGILHLIFEGALLYQSLRDSLEKYKKTEQLSPLKVSFLSHIAEELSNYMAFVNQTFNRLRNGTLKAFYIEFIDYICEFRIYHKLTRNLDGVCGADLLSELYILTSHGDQFVSLLAKKLFDKLGALYFEYLVSWLTKGQLSCHSEFFVQKNPDDSLMGLPYQLVNEKVPTFIPSTISKEVYMIGKTFVFLEKFCGEIHWINSLSTEYHQKYRKLNNFAVNEDLFELIHSQHAKINHFCRSILEKKFFLREILSILKDVLLMGRGDFIEVMMQGCSSSFDQPSNMLPSYRLTRCLQDSIRQSSLRNLLDKSDQNRIINGIDARVLELGHGSIGWDVFTLDYVIGNPLSLVLNVDDNDGRKQYLRMFNFLWRIKRNNYVFQREWKRKNALVRDFKKLKRSGFLVRDIIAKLNKVDILRNQFLHFLRKIEFHCLQNIVQKGFVKLQSSLTSLEENSEEGPRFTFTKTSLKVVDGILEPKQAYLSQLARFVTPSQTQVRYNIDDLRSIHNSYIQGIVSDPMLSSTNPDKELGPYSRQRYSTTLIILLGEMSQFIERYTQLNDVIYDILIQLNLHGGSDAHPLLGIFNDTLKNVVSRFKLVQSQCFVFIKDVKADGNPDLRNLSKILR
ncbi:LAMI_0B01816g1_1 [Lachancea mirantina]|uniref:Spindle pole body component n=1 Tax=Lachancea mirantina TaxID=1230905 RepID=A0A1G4ITV8_9SACH|nr:LAMI_0B01816g1_1 [Lachancea mirantina]